MTIPSKHIVIGDPADKYDLPAELVTPERLEAAALEQRQLDEKINSPYAHKTAQDIQRFNAGIIISETEAMLAQMPLNKLSEPAREQYAEALAEVGHFDAASKITKHKDRRKFYGDIWKAVIKDDAERCKCPKTIDNGKRINNRSAELDVWSHKHGKRMPVMRCNKCGHRNVTELPESIAKERDVRKRNRALVSGKHPDDARQILANLK